MRFGVDIQLKCVVFASISGACAVGGAAEKGHDHKGSGDWMKKKMEMMNEKLGLSEDQTAEVEKLIKDKKAKKKAAKAEMRTKIDAIKEEFSAGMKGVLSDEQYQKFDEMHKEMHKDKGSKGSHGDHKGSH